MDAYLWVLLAGALVSAALFAWRLERAGMKKKAALWALPLCVLMGTATARAVYFVSLCTALVPRYGLAGLWSISLLFRPRETELPENRNEH